MQTTSKPWYRHPWPWFLIALPATAVIASIITIWLAVQSADGLVTDDYYKQGMAINKTLDRDQAAQAMRLSAQLDLSDGVLRLKLAGQIKSYPDNMRLRLVHPTQSGRDQDLLLQQSGPGIYVHVLKEIPMQSGLQGQRWQVLLEPPAADWRLTGAWPAGAATIRLGFSEKLE